MAEGDVEAVWEGWDGLAGQRFGARAAADAAVFSAVKRYGQDGLRLPRAPRPCLLAVSPACRALQVTSPGKKDKTLMLALLASAEEVEGEALGPAALASARVLMVRPGGRPRMPRTYSFRGTEARDAFAAALAHGRDGGRELFRPKLLAGEELAEEGRLLQREPAALVVPRAGADGEEWLPVMGALWLTNFRLFFSAFAVKGGLVLGDVVVSASGGVHAGWLSVPLASLSSIEVGHGSLLLRTLDLRLVELLFAAQPDSWLAHLGAQLQLLRDAAATNVFARSHHAALEQQQQQQQKEQMERQQQQQQQQQSSSALPRWFEPAHEYRDMVLDAAAAKVRLALALAATDLEYQHEVEGASRGSAVAGGVQQLPAPHPRPQLREVDQGAAFAVCQSYPRLLVVPAGVLEHDVAAAAKHRSSARLPVVRWVSSQSGALLLRSSQPLSGLVGRRNSADRRLLLAAAEQSSAKALTIVDARGRPAVLGNTLQGKGVESAADYAGRAEVEFCAIGNIHTMRASARALAQALRSSSSSGGGKSFAERAEASGWLGHVSLVLAASARVAELLQQGRSVLVHCSDGFDRTPQLVCLAKLLVDARFRTVEGFCALVDAEWVRFGHRFGSRCGGDRGEEEQSPVFLQFLDCVWQLLQQRGPLFGFSEGLLLFLAEHAYSRRFGTFLCDSQRDAEHSGALRSAASLWHAALAPRPPEDELERAGAGRPRSAALRRSEPADRAAQAAALRNDTFLRDWQGPLERCYSRKALQLWRSYWLRDRPDLRGLVARAWPRDDVEPVVDEPDAKPESAYAMPTAALDDHNHNTQKSSS